MKQLDRMEWKLDTILQKLSGLEGLSQQMSKPKTEASSRPEVVLHSFTTRQHCVLQMVLRSASNKEIGDRMRITENSAKVHVRTIAKKLKVNTRSQIILATIEAVKEIDDESYRVLSGGIPKWWDARHEPDGKEFDELIFGGKDDTETATEG